MKGLVKSVVEEERGAALLLEAGIILPLVLLVVMVMIFSAHLVLQRNLVYSQLHQEANLAVRVLEHPADLDAFDLGNAYQVDPSKYQRHLTDYSPYRKYQDKPLLAKLEAQFAQKAAGVKVMPVGLESTKLLVKKEGLFGKSVILKKGFHFHWLPLLDALPLEGMADSLTFTVEASLAKSGDLVRRLDLALDLRGKLLKRFGVSGSSQAAIRKMQRFLNKVK